MATRSTSTQDAERQLMIKVKVCQRLKKEAAYYEMEVKENEEKLEKMKEAKRDPHDIKKFEEVLGESYMMVPDSKARFEKSLEDLSLYVERESKLEGEWLSAARSILEENAIADKAAKVETNVDDLKDGEPF